MTRTQQTHLILGDGVAGMNAAQYIRTRRPDDRIVIVSNDPQPFYYRAALTNFLSGALSSEELWAMPPHHWQQLNLERKFGVVAKLDSNLQFVQLEDGERIGYDRLLIATGCRAKRLVTPAKDPRRGIPGADLPGVFVMRTLSDTRRILESIGQCQHAVVLGGGILGIEVCHGLKTRNIPATLVHHKPWLLDRVVDRRAGELIAGRIQRDGIDVKTGSGIGVIQGDQHGIQAVVLNNGQTIACTMLITCIGNLPNTGWLAGSGIELNGGYIPVSRQMKVEGTDNIWAAGDAAHFVDTQLPFPNPGGLWQPAKKQGQIAGRGMVKRMEVADYGYFPGAMYNATRAWDLDLGTLGHHVDQQGETIVFDSTDGPVPVYKKLIVRTNEAGHQHVVGALLLGDRREGHAIKHLMNLRGAAADVAGIRDRIFDPAFDLAAWVAFRQNQPDVNKYQQTGVTAICAIPPSLVRGQRETKQIDMAAASPIETRLAVAKIDTSIRVRSIDGLPGSEHSQQTFRQRAVRIGARSDFDVVVSDAQSETLTLSLEGLRWVASTDFRRGSLARVNGKRLEGDKSLNHGDHLQLASWSAVVELGTETPASLPTGEDNRSEVSGFLRVGDQTHPIQENVTLIGTSSDNDIVLDDPAASSHHAQVHRRGDPFEYLVLDAGSKHGTFVNDDPVYAPRQLAPGDRIRIGSTSIMLSTIADAAEKPIGASAGDTKDISNATNSAEDWLEQTAPAGASDEFVYLTVEVGPDEGKTHRVQLPMTLGRSSTATVTINDTLLSRKHLRLDRNQAGYFVTDLASLNGVRAGGKKLIPHDPHPVVAGDVIEAGRSVFRFNDWQRPSPTAAIPTSATKTGSAFQIDFATNADPLTTDLRRTVRNELDACIGCHECMRACPLDEAPVVTIGALNSYGSSFGTPTTTTLDFVDHCTQCQACVPVCPVDIHRSRIVLWNQLKTPPDADKTIQVQVGNQHFESEMSAGMLSQQLADHPIFGCLLDAQRVRLCSEARFRSLSHHETIVQEGAYIEAVWFVIEGELEIGMATESSRFQPMVTLHTGQCVGEAAVLTDQPSDVSARANGGTVVMGLSKYSLKSMMKRPGNAEFRSRIEMLYANRSVQAFFRKQSVFDGVSDAVIDSIVGEFHAERYLPGKLVLSNLEAKTQLGIVKRGFVKEIRLRDGAEVVVNYLQSGDAFGAIESVNNEGVASFIQHGKLLRYEANTTAEVLTADLNQLRGKFPLFSSLIESRWVSRIPASPGATNSTSGDASLPSGSPCDSGIMTMAAEEGVLQAKQLLVINTATCVDCDNCVTACARRHGTARLDRSGTGRQIGQYQIPASCFHCEDPVCLLCSVDGIIREPTGEIRIIEDNCIGCRGCAERCPYDNIQMVPRKPPSSLISKLMPKTWTDFLGLTTPDSLLADRDTVAVKCDLCYGYNGLPACVRSCPTGAAERVDPIEHFMNLQQSGKS